MTILKIRHLSLVVSRRTADIIEMSQAEYDKWLLVVTSTDSIISEQTQHYERPVICQTSK